MAEIRPFRALRYDAGRLPIGKVVTQPYDKITPSMREAYLSAHPNNLVRVLRPADMPVREGESPYAVAARVWKEWRASGLVSRMPAPALFAYHQVFRVPGGDATLTRKGCVALTRLESYDRGVVFPHERTLSGPREDRLQLLRSTRTHFGQVFLAYSDPEERIDRMLEEAVGDDDPISVSDELGVEHRLWTVPDPSVAEAVSADMAGRKVLIADGHHRYETALAFRDEERERTGGDAGAFEWVMTTLVDMDSPGMIVLATHRLLHGIPGFDPARLLAGLEELFEIRDVPEPASLSEALAAEGERHAFGLAYRGGAKLLVLRESASPVSLIGDLDAGQAALDVVILHRLVLDRVLGLDEESIRRESYVRYLRDPAEGLARVANLEGDACFLLNPTPLGAVRDIAFRGGVLPQKSTDFYPKLLSGLVMYSED